MTDTDLTGQLAELIAGTAADHGTHDYDTQARDVLDWLDRRSLLATPATAVPTEHADVPMVAMPETEYEALEAEIARLRSLLGLQPGEDVCGASDRTGTQACLLPARHVGEGRWHQGLGGSWSL